MDLISKEAVNNLEKSDTKGSDYDRGWNDALCAVDMLPSAFEGMTKGEVIKALFPNMKVYEYTEKVVLSGLGNEFQIQSMAWKTWWNRPYKAGSEE